MVYKAHIQCRKYGKIKQPTLKDIVEFKKDLEREDKNMLLLRHPYLTAEQSHGHMKEIKKAKMFSLLNTWREETNEKFNRRVTAADRLNYLTINEAWD
ncbi:hypothetical protein WH47_02891 [Habropoda laboriosa]|uniref:Ribosomal protein 63, mitochondrial n=1 Tax=Habropoda laboriosa TaxID=597456 RepID=A0A0L7RHX2_9HYME|nr:hypothetical protein WH47_02891 [Habropoda laboriosa]